MSRNTVSIHYINCAVQIARYHKVDAEALLEEVGIPVSLLSEPLARVPHEQYTMLMIRIMKIIDDEFLLMSDERQSKPGTFALLCFSIIHCNNLLNALKRVITFYRIFTHDIHFKLHKSEEDAALSMRLAHMEQDPYHIVTESTLAIMHRLSSWLIGQRIELTKVEFAFPKPSHVGEYELLFRCPIFYDCADNSIHFSPRYLNYAVIQTEKDLRRFLRNAPAKLLVIPHNDNSLTAKIRAIIGKDFSKEFPDFETVARELHTTAQTLRRHLKAENTSYQEIKDVMRRDAAIYYLSKPNLSINEIAELMGFSEPSTFHRAFKKWTGLTPGAYRQGNDTTTTQRGNNHD